MARSEKETSQLLELAKLDKENLLLGTKCIEFDSNLTRDDLILFELDKKHLQKLISSNETFLKGNDSDGIVLCCDDQTFEIKETETSNSLLLFEKNLLAKKNESFLSHHKVSTLKRNYFELKPTKPSFNKLKFLLNEHQYTGETIEEISNFYTFDELLFTVQGSRKELENILEDWKVLFINNHCMKVDLTFLLNCFEQLMAILDSSSFDYREIPSTSFSQSLQSIFNKNLSDYMIKCFVLESSPGVFCLNEDEVCRLYAQAILFKAPRFKLDDFLETWKLSVPCDLEPSLSQIKDFAVVLKTSSPPSIFFLPCQDLPDHPVERFKALFEVSNKWTYEEIFPFLKPLAFGSLTVESLLMKHSRASTIEGVKYYGPK